MLEEYRQHIKERAKQGLVPKPLDEIQTASLIDLLKEPPVGEEDFILDTFTQRIPAGVDQAAYIKAGFLSALSKGEAHSPLLDSIKAIELLGTMLGGYNITALIDALENEILAPVATKAISHTLLMFDSFYDVKTKMKKGNPHAKQIMQSWAHGEWFTSRPKIAQKITVTVFEVTGETNTDDLSPAPDAWSRPDIPLHAQTMLKMERDGIIPDNTGKVGPIRQIEELKKNGYPLAYVGDVVGTGSSRKSAVNSMLWHIGSDIPFIPNKRNCGYCLGSKIAPIFFNTLEDAGALPIECDVTQMQMGDIIDIYPYKGIIKTHNTDKILCEFSLKTNTLLDEVRSGGRIALIIGRGLTERACETLSMNAPTLFAKPSVTKDTKEGFTLAQKIVGKACGMEGIRPGTYCEPKMTTVGSQDTTGPMTRDELKDLACLGFSADLTLQSFCHTAAYPKPVDEITHHTLPDFIMTRGGVSLRPGDGIIHSWLNRMLLPDTVGTGGDSHTRFPIGISFPAGSGLVAFAAATGVMPLDMPESVLVRFSGELQPGITLRDLVNAIPLAALKENLLTLEKKGKINVFSGRILEIEGLPNLKIEQAFELSDASAERSATGCTIKLEKTPIIEYLNSNITMLHWMIANDYGDPRTLERRALAMEAWINNPQLMVADDDARYVEIIEIDISAIKEPILACPNDPDDVKTLSEVSGTKIDEVFLGSCMTNIGHFRAAGKLLKQYNKNIPTTLWISPPTKMDKQQLIAEGYYDIYEKVGARIEMPGCSLCMGNQARVKDRSTVVSTSTRNFPNRLGDGANVYLASAEIAAIVSILGKIPSAEEYIKYMQQIDPMAHDIYRYLNFDQIDEYSSTIPIAAKKLATIPIVQAP